MSKFLSNPQEIIEWLKTHKVKNYRLEDDNLVSVRGSVDLSGRELKSLPVRFHHIEGKFDCSNNHLTSLRGSPSIVEGDFYCQDNPLASLKFMPQIMCDSFHCDEKVLSQGADACPGRCGDMYFYTWFESNDHAVTNLNETLLYSTDKKITFNEFRKIHEEFVILQEKNKLIENISLPLDKLQGTHLNKYKI